MRQAVEVEFWARIRAHRSDGSHPLGQQEYEEERTGYLEQPGYRVLRFWNKAGMNAIESVIRAIMQAKQS